MPYRNKTYVCFDGDNDMDYYRLMCAWKRHDSIDFNFYNAHDLNQARDTSQEESIKRQLKERMKNTKLMLVLIGEKTRYLYKFVRWEMEQAIALDIPIIGVNLNGMRGLDTDRCPPVIRDHLVVHVSFNAAIAQYAMDNWPSNYASLKQQNQTGARLYNADVYKKCGL
jgi:MTH538 TIR-like domain (DUF1863)